MEADEGSRRDEGAADNHGHGHGHGQYQHHNSEINSFLDKVLSAAVSDFDDNEDNEIKRLDQLLTKASAEGDLVQLVRGSLRLVELYQDEKRRRSRSREDEEGAKRAGTFPLPVPVRRQGRERYDPVALTRENILKILEEGEKAGISETGSNEGQGENDNNYLQALDLSSSSKISGKGNEIPQVEEVEALPSEKSTNNLGDANRFEEDCFEEDSNRFESFDGQSTADSSRKNGPNIEISSKSDVSRQEDSQEEEAKLSKRRKRFLQIVSPKKKKVSEQDASSRIESDVSLLEESLTETKKALKDAPNGGEKTSSRIESDVSRQEGSEGAGPSKRRKRFLQIVSPKKKKVSEQDDSSRIESDVSLLEESSKETRKAPSQKKKEGSTDVPNGGEEKTSSKIEGDVSRQEVDSTLKNAPEEEETARFPEWLKKRLGIVSPKKRSDKEGSSSIESDISQQESDSSLKNAPEENQKARPSKRLKGVDSQKKTVFKDPSSRIASDVSPQKKRSPKKGKRNDVSRLQDDSSSNAPENDEDAKPSKRQKRNLRTVSQKKKKVSEKDSSSRLKSDVSPQKKLSTNKRKRTFKCPVCKTFWPSQAHLERHCTVHTEERPFLCPLPNCGKRYKMVTSLDSHLLSHEGAKPHKCPYPNCDKAFAYWSGLNAHKRGHEGALPFKCQHPGCFKEFALKDRLRRHEGIHTRQYQCSYEGCGKGFGSKAALAYHQKSRKHN